MNTITVTPESAPEVVTVAKRAFPEYSGHKFNVQPFRGPMRLDSYWSGGSRNVYRIMPLLVSDRCKVFTVPENSGHPLQNGGKIVELSELPEGFVVVEHTLFCGKDLGLTVHVSPVNFNPAALQSAPVDMSDVERVVLEYTCALKSCARLEQAAKDTGITRSAWDTGKAGLIARGLLNKAGAVTPAGRNARQCSIGSAILRDQVNLWTCPQCGKVGMVKAEGYGKRRCEGCGTVAEEWRMAQI